MSLWSHGMQRLLSLLILTSISTIQVIYEQVHIHIVLTDGCNVLFSKHIDVPYIER